MIKSVDFAKYLLYRIYSENKDCNMNITKLLKLTYICDGFLLAYDINIIDECAKAWDYGPVYPKIHKYFTKHKNEIENPNISDNLKDSIEANPFIIYIIDSVIKSFSSFSAGKLSAWSHLAGSPWGKAIKKDGKYSIIEKADMANYFKGDVIAR